VAGSIADSGSQANAKPAQESTSGRLEAAGEIRDGDVSYFVDSREEEAGAAGPDAGEYPDLRGYLWSQLVNRLQAGDPKAMEELYAMFSNGIRYSLARQLGPDEIDDRLHDAFLIVVDAIRAGELRDPRRLMGFIRTVVKRMVASSIDRHVSERKGRLDDEKKSNMHDHGETPERVMLFQQQAGIVREVLSELSTRDRQILTRFYVDEQPAQQICEEMGLTVTQFRLLKSRAKNRFGELGKKKVQKNKWSQVFMRFSRS
jgi:RNA polymerase sigma factor (sigma-70 family)